MTLAALDYETKATYSVTVTASDSGGLSDSIDVTITVTNVDEMGRVTFWRGGADATTAAIMVGDSYGAVMTRTATRRHAADSDVHRIANGAVLAVGQDHGRT